MAEEIAAYAGEVSHHRIVVLLCHFLESLKEVNKMIAEELSLSERGRKKKSGASSIANNSTT